MAPVVHMSKLQFDALSLGKYLKAKKDPTRTEITSENRTGCVIDQAQCKHFQMYVNKRERNKGLDKGLIRDAN